MTLALLFAAQVDGLVREAEKLGEQVKTITTIVADLRDKKLVQDDALAEVESFFQRITGEGGDLVEKARRLEERQRALEVKKREVEILEREYESAKKVYEATSRRVDASRAELERRIEANRREIDEHNAKKDHSRNSSETEAYNQNAARLNQEKAAVSSLIDNFNNVILAGSREESARLQAKNDQFEAVDKERYELEQSVSKELRLFRARLDSMKNPTEQLLTVLKEATRPGAGTAGTATYADAAAAAASPLAQAYGSAGGLAPELAAEVCVIRRARDRSTSRDYLVQKLRLGMLIRSLAGFGGAGAQAEIPSSRAFGELRAAASPLVKKGDGATWSFSLKNSSLKGRAPTASIREE